MLNILKFFFGTKHERDIKKIKPLVEKINAFEKKLEPLSDKVLKEKTNFFKKRLQKGEKLESVLPEAFAVVREASKRTLKLRHFDVQMIGGFVLFQGKIAEMKTGEGKTLVATLTAYLRALEEKGVHVVTVNDHLAKRDANWMRPIYEFLGLSVGYIVHDLDPQTRKEMYTCDITYGTNNEFGFDYLRDNMVDEIGHKSQREHYFCIIDEVDSILIDEARTPLIISGPSDSSVDKYYQIDKIIPRLKEAQKDIKGKEVANTGDFIIDIKDRNLIITEDGVKTVEKLLSIKNLFDVNNMEILHHVNQGLKSHHLYKKNIDYIVENGEVVIIDEFTGRKMGGRRFSDGLHQAIEAKERVQILSENQTLASITFQNYFRMYSVISGMTGTADTEAIEFKKIYNLEVVCIPTNVSVARKDQNDKVYRTEKEKFNAISKLVSQKHQKGVPILIGTSSVENSEALSQIFKKNRLPHEVLNAKNHEREAIITTKAGEKHSITIATNMAGRGTDIKLGKGVKELGGLLVIGSERHESRRIDNQLRGRSGRQGDPGESIFYLSLEDDLMKRFGSEKLSNIMLRLGMEEGQEIENPIISRAIRGAQKKVEGINFEIRKYLLEYDDVMNKQRVYIYKERNEILKGEHLIKKIEDYFDESLTHQFYLFSNKSEKTSENLFEKSKLYLEGALSIQFSMELNAFLKNSYYENEDILFEYILKQYKEKQKEHPKDLINFIEKYVLLQILDTKWKDHLLQMDHLKEGINLRSYGEKKPLNEFKQEGFKIFKAMLSAIHQESMEKLFQVKAVKAPTQMSSNYDIHSEESNKEIFSSNETRKQIANQKKNQVINPSKIGRNEPCYCQSGKKYKYCHGKI